MDQQQVLQLLWFALLLLLLWLWQSATRCAGSGDRG